MNSSSPKARSLIVGASGQVGCQLARILGPQRTVRTSRRERPGWAVLDMASLADCFEADEMIARLQVDAVYCVGGMTDVERCEGEPEMAMRVNCEGPAALARAAARRRLPFVYFSTEYVFDGEAGPYAEDAPANPRSVYGKTKLLGEIAVRSAHADALIVRTTVVYGHDPGARNFLYTLRGAMLAGRSLRVAKDQVSTPTYNCDLATAVVRLVQLNAGGVFNVCGPERVSRAEFAVRAAKAIGWDPRKIVPALTSELRQRAPRPLAAGLMTDKLRRVDPTLRMRGVEESLLDWANGHALGACRE